MEFAQEAHQHSAEAALAFQRTRVGAWKAADVPRIRRLNEAVGPAAKLTGAEKEWLTTVLARKPRGRPGGKTGPQTLLEHIDTIWAWSQMPTSTPNQRREQLKKSHLFRPILAEAYASEFARQKALGKKNLPLHMSPHQAAEEAVADAFGISTARLRLLKTGLVEQTSDLGEFNRVRAWIDTGAE